MWHKYYISILLGLSYLLTGCLHTRHLQKDEYLLVDQYTVGNKNISNEELVPYYLQHTNRKLLGLPFSLWMYDLGHLTFSSQAVQQEYYRVKYMYDKKLATIEDPTLYKKKQKEKQKRLAFYKDKLKNGNFLMQHGEAPIIYSPEKRTATEKNLLQYLHAKGYFNAKVNSRLKTKDGKATVIYFIKENEPFILDNITLHCPDTAIYQLLQPYSQQSLLQKGQRYDQDCLIAERERIYERLLDQGYWRFHKQYIGFKVDTTHSHVAIETTISPPSHQTSHTEYNLDSIEFSIAPRPNEQTNDTTIVENGITFHNTQPHFSPAAILDKIRLQPGQRYKKTDILETQRNLFRLGIFKDIHISQELVGEQYLQTHIQTQLYDKFQVEQELGAEFTRIAWLPFYQLSLKSRNLLRRLEILSIRSQISIEAGSIPTDGEPVQGVQNFQLMIGGNVQQLLLPLPQRLRQKMDTYLPYTKVDMGYIFTNQLNYSSRSLTALLTYGWSPWTTTKFDFTPMQMNLVDFKLKDAFAKELILRKNQGNLSYRRYKPALHTQTKLKVTFQTMGSDKLRSRGRYNAVEILLESSGILQHLVDFRKIFGTHLTYYQYLKSSIGHTRHIPIRRGTLLAYHLYTGVLYPYSLYRMAPPEQYYFIGGPNSIRAWGTRGLGPGSYQSTVDKNAKFVDERPGEFILQANLELRQHLIGILESAFFIDAGNVWMLQQTQRKGEDFAFDRFYKEIAIGTGAGLYLNFNFIVLRVDAGIKLYNPAMPIGTRFLPKNMFSPTINFALGQPF